MDLGPGEKGSEGEGASWPCWPLESVNEVGKWEGGILKVALATFVALFAWVLSRGSKVGSSRFKTKTTSDGCLLEWKAGRAGYAGQAKAAKAM